MGSMFEAQHRTSTRMGLQASRATNLRGCRCNHVTSSIECIHWGVHSIKDQLLSLDQPQKFQQLKDDALKCDTCYWEHQGEKATPSGWNRQSASTSAPEKLGNNLTASSDALMTVAPTLVLGQMASSPKRNGSIAASKASVITAVLRVSALHYSIRKHGRFGKIRALLQLVCCT